MDIMGHINAKDIYRKLGKKIDRLPTRAPWNETFHSILKELYSTEEADVYIKMPYGLSDSDRVSEVTGYEKTKLRDILNGLASKGLVMDFHINGEFQYGPSPLMVGIFELTMMRTGENLNTKEWARLFHAYLQDDDSFWRENLKNGDKVSLLRTVPHEESVKESDHIEILDYESATALIESFDKFSIGICSCRHEKLHADAKDCDVPLEKCSSFGLAADYLIRNDFAKEVSKTHMLENLAQSSELGLVLNADNVKNNIMYLCHCCKCCCNPLLAINKYGYPNALVTSNFIAEIDEEKCVGCGKCAEACAVDIIEMMPIENGESKKKKKPVIETRNRSKHLSRLWGMRTQLQDRST
jgi:Fe-S-cluster-containing hydrogenase component 2